jgi:Tfp pilus assembly protein FimT
MGNERGMTLVDITVAVAVAAIALGAAAAYSVPMLEREEMRSSMYDVQTFLQRARVEAISRNHPCRFVLDTANRTVRVLDTNGTAALDDDIQLYDETLPSAITFANPGGLGAAVSFGQLGGSSRYQVVFRPDGTVAAGTGSVVMHGGDRFGRISVYGAGGIQVDTWNGSGWHVGG